MPCKDLQCQRCLFEWNLSDMVGARFCPNCGDRDIKVLFVETEVKQKGLTELLISIESILVGAGETCEEYQGALNWEEYIKCINFVKKEVINFVQKED